MRTSDTAADTIAGIFHATYETLAPEHGYETRKSSAVDWENVPANNKALMIAVVQNMLDMGVIAPGPLARHIAAKAVSGHKHVWQGGRCVADDCPDYCFCIAGGSGGHQRSLGRCPSDTGSSSSPGSEGVSR